MANNNHLTLPIDPEEFTLQYLGTAEYEQYDIAREDEGLYVSKIDVNQGNLPSTSTTEWKQVLNFDFLEMDNAGNLLLSDATTTINMGIEGSVGTIKTTTAHDLVFGTNNTERGRLLSGGNWYFTTNVGIGTSSPDDVLHLEGGGLLVSDSGAYTVGLVNGVGAQLWLTTTDSSGNQAERFRIGGNANNTDYTWSQGASGSETDVMALDTNGNLGVSPNATTWAQFDNDDIFKGVLAGDGAGFFGRTDGANKAYMSANAYYPGTNWYYLTSSSASLYGHDSGVHQWYTAASGTLGNPITWTERMRLTVDGNLGIGGTPVTRLGIDVGTQNAGSYGDAATAIKITGTADSSSVYGGIVWDFASTTGAKNFGIYSVTSGGADLLRFVYNDTTEVMTLSDNGTVKVNNGREVNSSVNLSNVSGGTIYTAVASYLADGVKVMASGGLLTGSTTYHIYAMELDSANTRIKMTMGVNSELYNEYINWIYSGSTSSFDKAIIHW
jgi:hypothetical protein